MYVDIVIYVVFSIISMLAYFKNFWKQNAEGQDIMVYLIIHIVMCLIFVKVFGL